jgi:hypothetical protein
MTGYICGRDKRRMAEAAGLAAGRSAPARRPISEGEASVTGRLGPKNGIERRLPARERTSTSTPALERHYRVRELAVLWGFSDNTIIKLFATEQGVIRLQPCAGKRKYQTLSIPESVAARVHERLGYQPLQTARPAVGPLRVIRLRDLHAGVSKQPGHIIKLQTA